MRPPDRALVVASLYGLLDRFLEIFADKRVPPSIRIDCWRTSNAITDLLYGKHVFDPNEPNGRRKRGKLTNANH